MWKFLLPSTAVPRRYFRYFRNGLNRGEYHPHGVVGTRLQPFPLPAATSLNRWIGDAVTSTSPVECP